MTTTADIPNSPGGIHFSHWSNGDPAWSGGPPQSDAVLTVSYLKAYFNTSVSTVAPAACGQGGPNAVCSVPDVVGAPDGNESARGAWFADGGDGKVWNGTGKAPSTKGAAVGRGSAVTGLLELSLVIVGLGLIRAAF